MRTYILILLLLSCGNAFGQTGKLIRLTDSTTQLSWSNHRLLVTWAAIEARVDKVKDTDGHVFDRTLTCRIKEQWSPNEYSLVRDSCNITTARTVEQNKLNHSFTNPYPIPPTHTISANVRRNLIYTLVLPDSNFTLDSFVVDTSMSKRELEFAYFDHRKHKSDLFLSANFTPCTSNSSIFINDPLFNSNDAYNRRFQNTMGDWGYAANLQVGITLKQKHTIFAEGNLLQQGFKTTKMVVDWSTGLPSATDNSSVHYRWQYLGFGLGYNYSAFSEKALNVDFEAAFQYNWVNAYDDHITTQFHPDVLNMRKGVCAGKAGLGISYRLNAVWAFRAIPTIIYDFTPINAPSVSTHLYNLGITLGVVWRPTAH